LFLIFISVTIRGACLPGTAAVVISTSHWAIALPSFASPVLEDVASAALEN